MIVLEIRRNGLKKTNIELPFILLILKLIKTTASRDCRPLADYNLRICRKYTPKSAISLFIFTCICRIMLQMLCTHAVTEFLSDYNYTSVSSVSVSRCNRWGEDVTPAAPGTFQQLNKIKQIYFHLYNFIYQWFDTKNSCKISLALIENIFVCAIFQCEKNHLHCCRVIKIISFYNRTFYTFSRVDRVLVRYHKINQEAFLKTYFQLYFIAQLTVSDRED